MVRSIIICMVIPAFFWVAGVLTNNDDVQINKALLGGSGDTQRQVLNITETCELFNTHLEITWENKLSKEATVNMIRISMDELCEKEGSFENKAVPAKEGVDGIEIGLVYHGIAIIDMNNIDTLASGYVSDQSHLSDEDSKENTSTVLESKHIRAINRFLLMFAGRKVENLNIENRKVTRDEKELQKIQHIMPTLPQLSMPIYKTESLRFTPTHSSQNTHPLLLQIVFHTLEFAETLDLSLRISKESIPKLQELLSILRYSKLQNLVIEMKSGYNVEEEPQVDEEAAIVSHPPASEQKRAHDIEVLQIYSSYTEQSSILPAWLIGSPTEILALNMAQYICLRKQEIDSIRAQNIHLFNYGSSARDIVQLANDAAQRREEGIANEKVGQIEITWDVLPETEEKTLKYIRGNLFWVAAQYPSVKKIKVSYLFMGINVHREVAETLMRLVVRPVPDMKNLTELDIFRCNVCLWDPKNKYMPFGNIQSTDDFSAGLKNMPFVLRPRLWKAFVNEEVEKKINKRLSMEKGKKDYIPMKSWDSHKNTENFKCPICLNKFSENGRFDWIYVTGSCRHIYCLQCMIKNSKSIHNAFRDSNNSENTKCPMHNPSLLMNWKTCWRVEEEGGSYKVIPSLIEEKEILVVKLPASKSTRTRFEAH